MTTSKLQLYLQDLEQQLSPSSGEMIAIAQGFTAEIDRTLAGKPDSLPVTVYSLALPSGSEQGLFVVLDIGGTMARALMVELQGQGRYQILTRVARTFRDAQGLDLGSQHASAADLFDFQAHLIAEALSDFDLYPVKLGYTFSFPSVQNNLNHCQLIAWAKEIKTPGVEGQDVALLLQQALERNGLAERVQLAVTINDTIATLLASAYSDPNTDIGSIIATGQNTCCLHHPADGKACMVNLECGNYQVVPTSRWDQTLDAFSRRPGEQLFEKMVSGQYIGELVRIIALDLAQQGAWNQENIVSGLQRPYCLEARQLAPIIADTSDQRAQVAQQLQEIAGITGLSLAERNAFQQIASLVVTRSAHLIAASFAGILWHLDPHLQHQHTIAIDGSLYEKMPGFASALQQSLYQTFAIDPAQVSLRLTRDGSAVGTAVAAAMVS